MKLSFYLGSFSISCSLCLGAVLSIPPSLTQHPSLLNTTALLNATLNEPPGFSYDFEYLTRGYQPMNEIGLYMTLLTAMFDLTFKPSQGPMPTFRTWTLPQYNVRVAVKAEQTQFGVSGLYAAFLNNYQFWPMLMKMGWQRRDVGQINVSYTRTAVGSSNVTDAVSVPGNDTDLGFRVPHYEYKVTPTGALLDARSIFDLVFESLILTADLGPDAAFYGFECESVVGVKAYLVFDPARDAQAHTLMTAREMTHMMTYVATQMVSGNHFSEAYIQVKRDGVVIGSGTITEEEVEPEMTQS